MNENLGRLEFLDPRTVWHHEARDFTPWLFSNADRLSEALGIDLEFMAPEAAVGDFSLDLLGRDVTNDCPLIVENQLEPTDHRHLGQLITYAAPHARATIVWVARQFRDEHRQAVDWLNDSTGEETHFFGVEIAVARIGDSIPAPVFRVVAAPNDWQKATKRRVQGRVQSLWSDGFVEAIDRTLRAVADQQGEWGVWSPSGSGPRSVGGKGSWIALTWPGQLASGTPATLEFGVWKEPSRTGHPLVAYAGLSGKRVSDSLEELELDTEAADDPRARVVRGRFIEYFVVPLDPDQIPSEEDVRSALMCLVRGARIR